MKNKLLKILALAFTCATLSAVATACGNGTLGNNGSSSSENSIESSVEDSSSEDSSSTLEEKGLTFKTLSVDGDTAYGKFSNAIEEFSFANEIALSGDTTFEVAKDKYGSQTYLLQEVPLNEGDNVFYVFEMNGKTVVNRYTVTLRRRRIYNVTFNTQGGTEVSTQEVEEDGFATMPEQPTRTGYTFNKWTFDFTKPISQNITINATWKINKYTLTIVYNNGQPDKEITQSYGSTLSLGTPKRDGYFFEGWDKTVMPAEDVTVTAQWQPIFTLVGGTVTGLTEAGKTLNEIEIPSQIDGVNITSIGGLAFYYCESLTSIEIPNSVTSIGDSAFRYCRSLTSIEIPNSVTSIGNGAFDSCDNLHYTIKENLKYLGNATNPYLYLAGTTSTSITSANIDGNCKVIGEYAFEYCSSLTSIKIPDSVMSIGNRAFVNCDSLTRVNYTGTIDGWAQISLSDEYANPLYYARNLYINDELVTEVRLTTATKIADNAFYNCRSLTSVEIPNSVTSIGEYAFYNCRSLTSIEVGKNNPYYQSIDGNLYSKNGKTLIQYAIGKTATSFIIPAGVTSIGDYAFSNCRSLTSIEIPNSVTSIGNGAFDSCGNLRYTIKENLKYLGNAANPYLYLAGTTSTSITSANIDGNCKVIGDYALSELSLLTSVVIPDSVISIGEGAFGASENLTSVVIGSGVTSIGKMAFYYCYSLTSIEIPDSVTSIGQSAFAMCENLVNVKLSNVIGVGAFHGSGLTSVVIPDSVNIVDGSAFFNCRSLTSVVIGSGVKSIEPWAFDQCYSLTDVYYAGTASEWEALAENIGSYNVELLEATRYYYVEREADVPQDGGKYWRYVDGVPTAW